MSTSIWRQSGRVSFANSQDFMNEQSISKNCRDSYEEYILNTKGEELPTNEKGYPITDWSYVDNQNNARYVATWNEKFSWGVMKTPVPKQQTQSPQTQEGVKYVNVTNGKAETQTKTSSSLSTPKAEESLAEIAAAVKIIADIVASKSIKRASDLIEQ